MARNKTPNETVEKILDVAKRLFLEKGFDGTTIQDIVNDLDGLSKGAVYHHFKSKEEIMQALCEKLIFENNSYDAVKERGDLNGLKKIQELIVLNQASAERQNLTEQTIPITKNPHILAAMMDVNQKVLTPQWLELIEKGIKDGSIQTEYAKELSELLPLLTLWLTPSIYPETVEELRQKFNFIIEMLTKTGLPLLNKDMVSLVKQHLTEIPQD